MYATNPTPCPLCGLLTFDGRVNVRTWTGDNGITRHFPSGPHADLCETQQRINSEYEARRAQEAEDEARNYRNGDAMQRFIRRARPLVEADPTLLDRMVKTLGELSTRP